MTTLDYVQRTQRIADAARNRIETNIAREWWHVTQPGGETFELWVPDGLTQAEVLKRYPGAGVVAK